MEIIPVENIHGLTDAEQRLVASASTGEQDYVEFQPDETIRAEVLKALLCGEAFAAHPIWPTKSSTIRILGGRVLGDLLARNRKIKTGLWCHETHFSGDIDFDGSATQSLIFNRCTLNQFSARRAKIHGFASFRHATVSFIDFTSAEITGSLFAEDSVLGKERAREAFHAQDCKISGIYLQSAKIAGSVVLQGLVNSGWTNLQDIHIDAESGLTASYFSTRSLDLSGSTILGPLNLDGATFNERFTADGIQIGRPGDQTSMFLRRASAKEISVTNLTAFGSVYLSESNIKNGVYISNSTIRAGKKQSALSAASLTTEDVSIESVTFEGGCLFSGSSISGSLRVTNSRVLACPDGYTFFALPSSKFGAISIADTSLFQLNLTDVRSDGPIELTRLTLNNAEYVALLAARSSSSKLLLKECKIDGLVDLTDSVVEGALEIEDSKISDSELALSAFSAKIGRILFLRSEISGGIDLASCIVAGPVALRGTSIQNENSNEFAINAFGLCAESFGLNPIEDESHLGCSVKGGINLILAQIRQDVLVISSRVSANAHIAIAGRGSQIGGRLHLFAESSIDGAVAFNGARIGSVLLREARLTSAQIARSADNALPALSNLNDPQEPWREISLDVSGSTISRLEFPKSTKHAPKGIIDLRRAKVGTFVDFKSTWPAPDANKHPILLDGFEYEHLENPDGAHSSDNGRSGVAKARLEWLRAQPDDALYKNFRPQPWQQLAKVLAAQGYEDDARKIAIERRVAIRYAEDTPRFQRAISTALHVLADYGFNPWKSVWWSLAVVAIFGAIYYAAALTCTSREPLCADQAAFVRVVAADFVPAVQDPKEAEQTLARVYPAFDPLLYSLDAFLPLFNLGTEPYWRPNENLRVDFAGISRFPLGRLLQWLYVLEQILGAVLASLIVTGFTGLLTRDER